MAPWPSVTLQSRSFPSSTHVTYPQLPIDAIKKPRPDADRAGHQSDGSDIAPINGRTLHCALARINRLVRLGYVMLVLFVKSPTLSYGDGDLRNLATSRRSSSDNPAPLAGSAPRASSQCELAWCAGRRAHLNPLRADLCVHGATTSRLSPSPEPPELHLIYATRSRDGQCLVLYN